MRLDMEVAELGNEHDGQVMIARGGAPRMSRIPPRRMGAGAVIIFDPLGIRR
jgi:hypothetical protein